MIENAWNLECGMHQFWNVHQIVTLCSKIIVYKMELDKTKWSCPCNSDQNCVRHWWGKEVCGVDGLGVVDGLEVVGCWGLGLAW